MLLKSLEIQGFKTFPDKTVLTFEDPFVAVVGPNGSGKSNVSDALRWVLGEQSVHALRCVKMEDVIFKGASGRKAAAFAEVTLRIDNTSRELDFDNDDISVSRRFYRSGESEYLINNAQVRLRDINELFMDTGLGRDGYSMIGQGKIDSIVSVKSEDRREVFEEAAGISRFRYKKEESERRLDKTEENLVRLRDILSELEDRVGPLKVQSEKAQKFIEYDDEKRGLEIGIWTEQIAKSEKDLRNEEDKVSLAKADYSKLENEIDSVAKAIEDNYNAVNACTVRMEQARSAASSLSEEAARIEGSISVLKNDITHDESDIERVESELEALRSSFNDIDAELLEKRNELDEKVSDKSKLNEKFVSLSDELERSHSEEEEIRNNLEASQKELNEVNDAISEKRILISADESSLNEIKNRGDSISTAVNEGKEALVSLQNEREVILRDIEKAEEEISAENNSIDGYTMKLSLKTKKRDEMKSQLDKLNLDAGEHERRARILEDLEKNYEGFAQSVRAVMREAERGIIHGVHGPVTQIIHAASEYSTAIEIALGASLQNIVVDSEADARNAISFLKRRNAGRATFLPLSTIKGNRISTREVESMNGFIGLAADLVKCEERYQNINNFLLGRIIVCDSLDNATAIARRLNFRNRIVTLDGQVINAGGSFTGGSLARNAGLLDRANEISRLKELAQKIRKDLSDKNTEYKKLSEEMAAANAELDLANAEKSRLNEKRLLLGAELTRNERDIESAKQRLADLEKESSGSLSRIRELENALESLKKETEKLEANASKLRTKIDYLRSDRSNYTSYINELQSKLQNVRIDIISVDKDKDAIESAIETLETRKSESGESEERLKLQSEQLREHIETLKNQIVEFKESAQNKKSDSESKTHEIAAITEERNLLEKQSAELRTKERELNSKKENIGLELARLNERKETLQKDLDLTIAKLWEEYELTRREAEEQAIRISDLNEARRRLTELRSKIKALGSVNVAAVVEYKEVSERYNFLKDQIADVEKSRLTLIKLIGELTVQMKEQYARRFKEINTNFTEIFRELFGGGNAYLEFSDKENILTSGIEIKVHPPGKVVSNIEAMSGGEKALIAISIYFAIMKVSPPPFCMLDEVEAALDDANVERFADYLHRMNENTQFIVVTHRRGTMESADSLYGVTMQDDGISRVLHLDSKDATLE